MELWIRSQDKECFEKVRRIEILENPMGSDYLLQTSHTILGRYKTKERALEILDEIQEILKPKPIIKIDDIICPEDLKTFEEAIKRDETIVLNRAAIEHLDTYVYEMPKE